MEIVSLLNLILALYFACFVGVSDAQISAKTISPCSYQDDKDFGGILVDCRGKGFTSLPPPEWIPSNTTSIHLQDNKISRIDNASFVNAVNLRYISLAKNELLTLDPYAFGHCEKIQIVDLELNHIRLDNASVRTPLFYNLPTLTELRLSQNQNDERYAFYAPNLLVGLPNLHTITLDTFQGDLDFNGIFTETKGLTFLDLSGGFWAIRNESFQDFDEIALKELIIHDSPNYMITENGAFRFFISLDSFSLQRVPHGTKPTLDTLAPFVHQKMTTLHLSNLNAGPVIPATFKRDSQLTRYMGRYLSKICVKNFIFTSNNVFFIDQGTLTGVIWQKCLVSLDVSDNPLLGNVLELAHMRVMQSLQFIRVANRKYSFLNKNGMDTSNIFNNNMHNKRILTTEMTYQNISKSLFKADIESMDTMVRSTFQYNKYTNNMTTENTLMSKYSLNRFDTSDKSVLRVFLPKALKSLQMPGVSSNSISFDREVVVIGGKNMKELHCSDSGVKEMTTAIHGLEGLETVDLSKNDGSQLTQSFLSSFPMTKRLNMASMGLSHVFSSPENHNILQDLHKLEFLDLSKNDLYYFPSSIFHGNRELKYLNLFGNRLKAFPFDLENASNLQKIDLRSNSFLQLSHSEMIALEQHGLRVSGFSLLLQGNVFSCGCSNIRFLKWLQTTTLNIDEDRNYSCILEDGQITTTSQMRNIAGLWRLCQGEVYFLISIIILCIQVLGFSLLTIGIKYQTQLKAMVFQYFSRDFILKTSTDYPLGVYVGYADPDTDFACGVLRNLIENQIRLPTYLRHRDLLPASNMAESIVSAVHNSWRGLLVVTSDFLNDPWSHLAMKTAVYSVQPDNPARLVIIFFCDDIETRIPTYVLSAVHQENIIKLSSRRQFTESEVQAIRAALVG